MEGRNCTQFNAPLFMIPIHRTSIINRYLFHSYHREHHFLSFRICPKTERKIFTVIVCIHICSPGIETGTKLTPDISMVINSIDFQTKIICSFPGQGEHFNETSAVIMIVHTIY